VVIDKTKKEKPIKHQRKKSVNNERHTRTKQRIFDTTKAKQS
jgi:hypothetical protein